MMDNEKSDMAIFDSNFHKITSSPHGLAWLTFGSHRLMVALGKNTIESNIRSIGILGCTIGGIQPDHVVGRILVGLYTTKERFIHFSRSQLPTQLHYGNLSSKSGIAEELRKLSLPRHKCLDRKRRSKSL